MSFLNLPMLFFLLLVPLLILLYFLKLKRPTQTVSSTLLWQKVVEDMRVNAPFQKLRKSFLLLLQLLILLGIIFALARPLMSAFDTEQESFIVLIDTSASMAAVEEDKKTRLDLARTEIEALVDNLNRGDEVMLISFNSTSRIAASFTTNKHRLKDALARLTTTECPTRITPALNLARSVANSRDNPRILIWSDGAFEQIPDLELPVALELKAVGTKRSNVALVGLDLRRGLNDRSKVEMFVAAENFGAERIKGTLNVKRDDQILASEFFAIDPSQTLSRIYEAEMPDGGNIEVELVVDDALALDNRAWKIVMPPRPRRVLLVGENLFFLSRMFKAASSVEFNTVSADAYDPAEARKYSTIIWSKVEKPQLAPADNIYIACAPEGLDLQLGDTIAGPSILDWDSTHSISRFIDFDNLIIAETQKILAPDYATSILDSTGTSLISVMEHDAGHVCLVGFDPLNSNWPLLVSFPLFFNNALGYFDEQRDRRTQNNSKTGDVLTAPSQLSSATIKGPNGTSEEMIQNSTGDYTFSQTEQAGLYQVFEGDQLSRTIAVNLFDRKESSLTVEAEPQVGSHKIKPFDGDVIMRKEFWHELLIIVLAVLAIEWVVYHRRIFL
jgi:Ca-activated chloride channel family protein